MARCHCLVHAYTEYYNAINADGITLTVVYKINGAILRNANTPADIDGLRGTFAPTGFRLPTKQEWEFVARLRKDSTNSVSGKSFTTGNLASGANVNCNDNSGTSRVAWYTGNSANKTHDVATRVTGALGLYDISGNI